MELTTAEAVSRVPTVVIVNGTQDMLEVLDSVLEPGHYDVVIADSTNDAYSLIKDVKPHLVLLGLRVDNLDGFQVLSMLKLDPDTRSDSRRHLHGRRRSGRKQLAASPIRSTKSCPTSRSCG